MEWVDTGSKANYVTPSKNTINHYILDVTKTQLYLKSLKKSVRVTRQFYQIIAICMRLRIIEIFCTIICSYRQNKSLEVVLNRMVFFVDDQVLRSLLLRNRDGWGSYAATKG